MLFEFQKDIVKWALRLGRACIFSDCGTGKSFMQIEWARQIPGSVLILAPLAVAQQTVAEGVKLGVEVRYCRSQSEVAAGITITNYEMLHKFDPAFFNGVVLDESSILKSFMGKTKLEIIHAFDLTPFKLACTATPAPNDHMEIGNHAEFIGVMRSSEMLASFFINDPSHVGRYRIKGHAVKPFWKWVASWAAMIRKPSDLGYSDEGFNLPPISINWHTVNASKPQDGYLFELPAASLAERISARRNSIHERVEKAVELANSNNEQWLIFCALNNESHELAKQIKDSIEVVGSDSIESKTSALLGFAKGETRALVSKPSICGFGMNFQSCHNIIFVGLTDSWEQYYQAKRRVWRFGQKKPVNCHIITASTEGAVVSNILRKEQDAERMFGSLTAEISQINKSIIHESNRFIQSYHALDSIKMPKFLKGEA
jgi:superfamily II DNA or RNA helicase